MKIHYKQEELNNQPIWRIYVDETPMQAHAGTEREAIIFCQGMAFGAQWILSEMPERPYF